MHNLDDNIVEHDSEDEVVAKDHFRFVDAIRRLDNTQHIQKATRNEPSIQTSEFHLVKSNGGINNSVLVGDLFKILGKTAKHVQIGKTLRTTQKNTKTLKAPLEKPQADRIQRCIGFENAKNQLRKWEAVVTSNRYTDHLSFPLKKADVSMKPTKEFLKKFVIKSQLEKDLEALKAKSEAETQDGDDDDDEFPLTMEEIVERRQEAAKLRAQQSYRESKAKRQSKIKSKKFHRIQKREKIKKQIQEFELLQKTDPEAALRQLELLDRTRAKERASLRHRNTGQWAKNLQVRAKYDKESRQELAQQLAVSRDLTQKVKPDESSETEEDEQIVRIAKDPSNPWMKPVVEKEVSDFVTGYRKYWQNLNQELKDTYGNSVLTNNEEITPEELEKIKTLENVTQNVVENSSLSERDNDNKRVVNGVEIYDIDVDSIQTRANIQKRERKLNKKKGNSVLPNEEKKNPTMFPDINIPSKTMDDEFGINLNEIVLDANGDILETHLCTSSWSVSDCVAVYLTEEGKPITEQAHNTKEPQLEVERITKLKTNTKNGNKSSTERKVEKHINIDALFDDMEDDINAKVKKKLEVIKKDMKIKNEQDKFKIDDSASEEEYVADLSFKANKKYSSVDEAMNETANCVPHEKENNLDQIIKLSVMSDKLEKEQIDKKTVESIDPNKFIAMKSKHLLTALPDMVTAEEDIDDQEEKVDRQLTIAEAFEDDDIVGDFRKEKDAEINKDKPEDIDLSMPGWGSWGGQNIKVSKRKKKRFIVKFPKVLPRRDDNKGDVIINENSDAKIKPHLVSKLPFPFTSVRDYEASIRAPIGTTFVPETAHKKLTRPAITTKMGTIIEPMDDDILVNRRKRKYRK